MRDKEPLKAFLSNREHQALLKLYSDVAEIDRIDREQHEHKGPA